MPKRFSARARAFEMRVLAFDPYLDDAVAKRLDIELGELDEVLPEADFLTLHVPLTEHTRNILSAERIAALKDGAMLVNCARGGTVDDAALLAARILGSAQREIRGRLSQLAERERARYAPEKVEAEIQERIFDPFFSTRGKHRGVGLSTVVGVARAHGALLSLETRPGLGSAFTLYLPV